MECWAALSYCKRDIDRGPINPRQPKDFQNFAVLEYRQELRGCNLNELYQYQCVEKESELCFEVLRNFQDPLPGVKPSSPGEPFPHEIGVKFPGQAQAPIIPAFIAKTTTTRRTTTTRATTTTTSRHVITTPTPRIFTVAANDERDNDSDIIFPAFVTEESSSSTTASPRSKTPRVIENTIPHGAESEGRKLPKFCNFIKCENRNQNHLCCRGRNIVDETTTVPEPKDLFLHTFGDACCRGANANYCVICISPLL